MSLITPTISDVSTFDATSDNLFFFEVYDPSNTGTVITQNEIKIIRDNFNSNGAIASTTVVYQNIQKTSNKWQNVPANTLTNGYQYQVCFRTYDADNNTSSWSNSASFYCYKTPTMTWNFSDDAIVYNATTTLTLTVTQVNNLQVDSAYFILYDSDKNELETTDEMFNTNTPSYTFAGLENGKTYYVQAYVTMATGDEWQLETPLSSFKVHYDTTLTQSPLRLITHSCDGYITIKSTVSIINGTYYPTSATPTYVSNDAIDLTGKFVDFNFDKAKKVVFNDGFELDKEEGFTFRCWLNPCQAYHTIAELGSSYDSNFKVTISYQRTSEGDIVVAESTDGEYMASSPIEPSNGNCYVFVYVQCDTKGRWTVNAVNISKVKSILDYNGNSNLDYSTTTDLTDGHGTGVYQVQSTKDRHLISQNITSLTIGNGVYYKVVLDNGTIDYDEAEPTGFQANTYLFADFKNNLKAGTTDIDINEIAGYKIKRKDENTQKWIELYSKRIYSVDDFKTISYNDFTVPSGIQQTYAFVPLMSGDIEGNYIVNTVTPVWNYCFLTDTTQTIIFNVEVAYDGDTQNVPIGVLAPIGKKYPVVIQNSDNNYRSGSISAKLVGENFMQNRVVDRVAVTREYNKVINFLTNGKPKLFKDWNGQCLILRTSAEPTGSYDTAYTNGVITFSFSWVEQGNYDNQDDLTESGFNELNIV